MMNQEKLKAWIDSGTPWIWLNATAVSICLIMVVGVLGLVAIRGTSHFWPGKVMQMVYKNDDNSAPKTLIGEHIDTSLMSVAMAKANGHVMAENEDKLVQFLMKTGNRDLTGSDFGWILERNSKNITYPKELVVIERREWGNFYGNLLSLKENGNVIAEGDALWNKVNEKLTTSLAIFEEIKKLEKKEIGAVNYSLERLRLQEKSLQLKNQLTADSMNFIIGKKSIKSMYLKGNSFIVSKEDSLRFNQIRGKEMKGYFKNDTLYLVHVEGNGQTIYYVKDKDVIKAVNRADCSDLNVYLKNNKIKNLVFITKPDATLYPLEQIDVKELKLKDFTWREQDRPLKVMDIFNW